MEWWTGEEPRWRSKDFDVVHYVHWCSDFIRLFVGTEWWFLICPIVKNRWYLLNLIQLWRALAGCAVQEHFERDRLYCGFLGSWFCEKRSLRKILSWRTSCRSGHQPIGRATPVKQFDCGSCTKLDMFLTGHLGSQNFRRILQLVLKLYH